MFQNNLTKKQELVSDFDKERSIIGTGKHISQEEYYKNIVGLIIYIFLFVAVIPHYLLKRKSYVLSALYFSNLDLIATVLGFSGGPFDIWKYLYNPSTTTFIGDISSNIINYFSLIGVGYVCLEYATRKKRIFAGLSLLMIILPITYLFPGNLIVYIMNNVALQLEKYGIMHYITWTLTLIVGFITVVSALFIEKTFIKHISGYLEKLLLRFHKYYK